MRGRVGARLSTAGAIVLSVALALVAHGCGSQPTETVTERPLTAPPQLPLPGRAGPAAALDTAVTTVPAEQRLPNPVAIPLDGYTDEPVVLLGSIEIPRIGLDHTLYQGVTLHNIDEGPSHWTGTALPGQRGNAVIAGHRVTHSRPFRHIDQLKPGDEVIFRVDGVRSVYSVTGSMVVTPDDTWIGNQSRDSIATLYACHPPGSAAERYVVRMALVSTAANA